jgi:hypothetical protein
MQSKDSVFQLQVDTAAGAVAEADVAIEGITTIDSLVSVVGVLKAAGSDNDFVDLTSHYTIPSDGNVESDQDDSLYTLLVFWVDRTAG